MEEASALVSNEKAAAPELSDASKRSAVDMLLKFNRKNPRAAVSVYFVVLCVALAALMTSAGYRRHHRRHSHHQLVVVPHSDDVVDGFARDASVLAARTTTTTKTAKTTTAPTTVAAVGAGNETKGEEGASSAENLKTAIIVTCCMLMLSAVCAGLTLGVMGLDTVNLEVIASAAPEPERSYAQRILPVRHLGHQTLSTLIVTNMFCNVVVSTEAGDMLPETPSGGGVGALISFFLSTFLILIFAEIVPMSLCSGPDALKIAAASVPLLKVLLFVTYPITKPLGWMLDKLLDHDPGQIYDREELKRLFTVHAQRHQAVSGLKTSELDLLLGAFDFGDKRVKDVMTPFETVVVLRIDAVLDAELLRLLWSTGHSRIPVVDLGRMPASQRKQHPQRGGVSRAAAPAASMNNTMTFNATVSSAASPVTQALPGVTWEAPAAGATGAAAAAAAAADSTHKRVASTASAGVSTMERRPLTVQDLKIPADMLSYVDVVGILFVKDLLLVMDQNLTVEEALDMFPHGDVFSVWHGAHLRNLLTSFQQGQCHLVFVRENKFQVMDAPQGGGGGGLPASPSSQAAIVPGASNIGSPHRTTSPNFNGEQHGTAQPQPQQHSTSKEQLEEDDNAASECLCYVQPEDRMIGIITLEALIETLIRAPIWDEHDDEEDESKQKEMLAYYVQQGELQQHQQQQNPEHHAPAASPEQQAEIARLNVAATAVSRHRHQLKSVHFFDLAVSHDDIRGVPEGTAVRAPPLTAPQCLAIGRFLIGSVDSFSVFHEVGHLAKLIVGSDCFIVNPRRPREGHEASTLETTTRLLAAGPIAQPLLQLPFSAASAVSSPATLGGTSSNFGASMTVAGSHAAGGAVSSPAGLGASHSGGAAFWAQHSREHRDQHLLDQPRHSLHGQHGTGSPAGGAPLPPPPATPSLPGAAAAASFFDCVTPDTTFYTRGQRSHYFTLVLGGTVRIVAGNERFHSEIHTFAWLGERALESPDGFVPRFDAFAATPCRVLRISTRTFAAVRQVAFMQAAANIVQRAMPSASAGRYVASRMVASAAATTKTATSSDDSVGGKDDIELMPKAKK